MRRGEVIGSNRNMAEMRMGSSPSERNATLHLEAKKRVHCASRHQNQSLNEKFKMRLTPLTPTFPVHKGELVL